MRYLVLLLTLSFSTLYAGPIRIPLWGNGAPGTEGKRHVEEMSVVFESSTVGKYTRLSQVHNPSIEVYPAPKHVSTGTSVIVAPGGGFRFLSIDLEGSEVVAWLNSIGVTGIVLKYRLPKEEGSTYNNEDVTADFLRAFRQVRYNADKWGLKKDRIGVMGFSASGYAIGRASFHYDTGDSSSEDPVERESSRADFQIMAYGFHLDEKKVPADTPPTFMVCAYDDKHHPKNATTLFQRYLEAGVPTELHIYSDGGHAFSMRNLGKPINSWNLRLKDWMESIGMLDK